jgi:hypothetical protein
MCPQEFGDRHTEKLLRQKDSLAVMAQCAVPGICNDLLRSKSRATIRCLESGSTPSTQVFLAVGTLFRLPIIITYTGWSYWVFRGEYRHDIGYHLEETARLLCRVAKPRCGVSDAGRD